MKHRTLALALSLGVSVLAFGYLLGRAQAGETGVVPLLYSGLILEDGAPTSAETASVVVTLIIPGTSEQACEPTDLPDVELRAGTFQVPLHDSCLEPIKSLPVLLVKLEINGEELPQRALGAVPYALHAQTADNARTLDGESPGRFARVDHAHTVSADGGAAPIGVGTDSSLRYLLATVKVGGDLASEICNTPQCEIAAQSGSVASVERSDEGNYWVYFKPRTYSDAPTCTCNPFQGNNTRGCTAVTPSRDAVLVHTYSPQAPEGSQRDFAFELICVGPAAEDE